MTHPDNIPEMEKELAVRSVPVAELCRRAGIAETTWGRWKRGDFKPSFRAWSDVTREYDEIVSVEPSEGDAVASESAA